MILRARHFELSFPRPALIMGVVNVTPDSFSDGGNFFDARFAVEHGLKLIEQGADILDIGGESTRPHARPVAEAEELRRVIPVIEQLAARVKVPLSIDTMKPGVARAAIQAGASIINDVAANSRGGDAEQFQASSVQFSESAARSASENWKRKTENFPEMWRVVAETGAGYVCLHMQGTPQTMQANPIYTDVVREVGEFFFERMERMRGCGVPREQIILDVGIGFGKALEHNLQLLAALGNFQKLGRPLLLGASRKSFMGKLPGAQSPNRLPASLACACLAVAAGVQLIRVHDVAETARAVRLTEAVLNRKPK